MNHVTDKIKTTITENIVIVFSKTGQQNCLVLGYPQDFSVKWYLLR